jgi:DNA polymerase III alpha subunit
MASIHPMEYYRRFVRDPQVVHARDLERHVGRTVKVAGILVTAKTVLTKNAELMQFVSFEDETAIFETVLFPRVYKKNVSKLSNQQPYVLTGRVDAEFGVISLNVFDIEMMSPKRSPAAARPSPGGSRKQIIDAVGDGA